MRKLCCSILAVAGFAVAGSLSVYAQEGPSATTDPEQVIYRVAGVISQPGFVSTVFTCSNQSPVEENVRVVIRLSNGAIAANNVQPINSFASLTWVTIGVAGWGANVNFNIGVNPAGFSSIATTNPAFTFCSMRAVNPAGTTGFGLLHLVRINPIPGTQE